MNKDLLGKLGILGVTLALSAPAMSGCKAEPAGDGDGDTTGDGDGDGDGDTSGDGDGDTTGDGDGDTTGDGDGDTTGDGDGDPTGDCEHLPIDDGAADGETCLSNGDCMSNLCEVFQDVPPVDGTCQPAPAACETRIMARVLDFTTRETVEGIDLRVAAAIQASVDPIGAMGLATGTSDVNGEIDVLSDGPIEAALGVIGLAEGGDYYLTATGLASPLEGISYGPANAIRDIWVVPAQSLTDWSGMLMGDPEFENQLPLGDAGGVVGMVRDAGTGDLVAGAVVVPTSPDTSNAKIRYLNDAGDGFVADMTSSMGVFVIVSPGLGETFDVELGGMAQGVSGTGGSAAGAAFTLIMDVTP